MSDEVTAVDPHAPVHGFTVGPWLILERLDSGTFGVVFRAQRAGHPEALPVALKMARNPQDPRFPREAELLQRCLHPCIPGYEDMGVWTSPKGQRYPYLVMEWVEGLTLYDWFREQPRSSREVLQVLAQLAGALATAHARGAVHRDVKGDNIRVTAAGRAVLVDWGSGWFAGAKPLTDTTAPPGTTAYRPPEQKAFMWLFRKDSEARWHSTPADDLYALGVVLYRMVTGVYLPPCTDGGEPVEREVLPPSAMATVSLELEALTLRLLCEDRQARGTAEQLEQDVQGLVETAGPAADKPILLTPSAVPTEEGGQIRSDAFSDGQDDERLSDTAPARPPSTDSSREERRRPAFPSWRSLVSAGLVSGMVVALAVRVVQPSRPEPPERASFLATPEELAPFATDGGVAEEALSSVQDVPGSVLPTLLSLGRSMPEEPLPGQRTPPCKRGEREINGGCWRGPIEGEAAPCGDEMYDHEGKCYFASGRPLRPPTSGTP